ncbi:hypothetical protein K443DRAFT_14689 [Laccaria amethystina LaAM-08-1]|uniref:Uncharacterized protein n=1 Tax=Laccaria amethystina LaAM-08-1 TaxID=1095629 RepID=A0A0C9WMG3_9AGAR|nr:hypothetical protein K443DRAFT_14689 [Laccaria amethystina LaAM-08-1]
MRDKTKPSKTTGQTARNEVAAEDHEIYCFITRSPRSASQGPASAANEVPDGPPLQSPLVRRTAPPRVYVEENSQEELQPAWDDGNLTNPTPPLRPLSPDRNIQQLPSSSGKVAYVIFGDHETDGVFNNWVACEHRLDLYLRTLGRKPPYYGYSTREHARAAWQNFLQSGAIWTASRMPSSQPTTPQRNRQMNLQSPAHSRPSPHSLHNLPTTSQHGANPSSTRSPPPLQYSVVPPLSQPHMLITRQDADTSL